MMKKVATIREGFVKAIGDGVATLTATSRDGEKSKLSSSSN